MALNKTIKAIADSDVYLKRSDFMAIERLTYSVVEVAKMLGIGRNLAYQLVQDGKIDSFRIGDKRILIPKAVLEKFLSPNKGKRISRLVMEDE